MGATFIGRRTGCLFVKNLTPRCDPVVILLAKSGDGAIVVSFEPEHRHHERAGRGVGLRLRTNPPD